MTQKGGANYLQNRSFARFIGNSLVKHAFKKVKFTLNLNRIINQTYLNCSQKAGFTNSLAYNNDVNT